MKISNDLDGFFKFLKRNESKKIFIITGKNSFSKSGAKKLLNLNSKKKLGIYYKKNLYPEISELKKIFFEVKKFNPKIIFAIGGGSVIDYAKIVSVLDNSKEIKKIIVKKRLRKKKYLTVAVPTTAGSGAEVTPSAVIYINKTKYSVENQKILPNKYFLIPKLTISNSKKNKAASGFDAISQSIESLISMKSDKDSVKFACKSLHYSLNNFVNFVNNPNIFNAKQMMIAANLSGKAIAISKTIAPHALSYPFTAHFGVPHGHAVSLTLEKFLFFNYKNADYSKSDFNLADRFKLIFKATKTKNIKDLTLFLNKLKRLSGLTDDFFKLGININKDSTKILRGVNKSRLNNNPVPINLEDLISIIK
jgi:alcohol dehydrogenase class IV